MGIYQVRRRLKLHECERVIETLVSFNRRSEPLDGQNYRYG